MELSTTLIFDCVVTVVSKFSSNQSLRKLIGFCSVNLSQSKEQVKSSTFLGVLLMEDVSQNLKKSNLYYVRLSVLRVGQGKHRSGGETLTTPSDLSGSGIEYKDLSRGKICVYRPVKFVRNYCLLAVECGRLSVFCYISWHTSRTMQFSVFLHCCVVILFPCVATQCDPVILLFEFQERL